MGAVLGDYTVKFRKLEHGFRRFGAGIPYSLPEGNEDIDVPTFWLLLYRDDSWDPFPPFPTKHLGEDWSGLRV